MVAGLRSRLLLTFAAALFTLLACGEPGGEPSPAGTLVGPNGGRLEAEGAVLSIPPGALDAEVSLKVEIGDEGSADVAGRVRISRVYRFLPESTRLLLPATLVIPYRPEQVPPTVRAGLTDLRRVDFTLAQQRLDFISVDTEARTVSGETRALGSFWATIPEGPRPDTVQVTPEARVLFRGDSVQFTAEARDLSDRPIADAVFTWSSSDPSVATVDESGRAVAVAPGVTQISARSGSALGTARLSVADPSPFPKDFRWENPHPQGNDLLALRGDAQRLALAGEGGTLLLQTTAGWASLPSVPNARLEDVAPLGAGAVAVGAAGEFLGIVVDAAGAQPGSLAVPDTALRAVWVGPQLGMAVGEGPNIALLEDGAWRVAPSPVTEPLLAAGGDPATGRMRVVGARGSVYVYEAGLWLSESAASLPQLQQRAIVRGEEAFALRGAALSRFAAGGWSTLALPATPSLTLTGLGLAGTSLLVWGDDAQGMHHLLLEEGGAWSELAAAPPERFFTYWGRAADDLYAAGARGSIAHFDGATWTALRSGPSEPVVALAAFPGPAVFAAVNACADAGCASTRGEVLRRDPATGRFAPLTSPIAAPLRALGGRSATDLWAVGEGAAWHYDGAGWTQRALPSGSELNALAACPAGVYAIGDGDLLVERAGTWERAVTFDWPMRALGCSGDTVWVAGDVGIFRVLEGQATVLDPTDWDLRPASWRAVWASPEGKVFFGGEARYLLVWNGEAFEAFDRPGNVDVARVLSLWGTSYGNVWAGGERVGGGSFLAHFNGAWWQVIDAKSAGRIEAFAGLPSGESWLGGAGGAILHGPLD